MDNAQNDRISFPELDVHIAELLDMRTSDEAQAHLRQKINQTTYQGEKIMFLSRLIACLAIDGSPAALAGIPEAAQELLSEVNLNPEEEQKLQTAFKPLLNQNTVTIHPMQFSNPPESFRSRLADLPVYENKLEILATDTNEDKRWVQLHGTRPILKEKDVLLFMKRLITSCLMEPAGANVYEELEKHHHLLESDLLYNPEIIKDFSIDEKGDFSFSLRDIFQPGVLDRELEKHVGTQKVLDQREASGIAGYIRKNNSEYEIKEVIENPLGLFGHVQSNQTAESLITEFQEKGLEVAHLHTHPDITFFSFTDITLHEARGLESDIAAYLSFNENSKTKTAGIVFIGFNTGFMYLPEEGIQIVKVS